MYKRLVGSVAILTGRSIYNPAVQMAFLIVVDMAPLIVVDMVAKDGG